MGLSLVLYNHVFANWQLFPQQIKRCCRCHTIKPFSDFYKKLEHSDQLSSSCKTCGNKYYQKNKTKYIAQAYRWQKQNPEKFKLSKKKYGVCLKSKQYKRQYKKQPLVKLINGYRHQTRRMIKKHQGRKSAYTLKLIGCTATELSSRIEKQFKPGMNWENRRTVWDIDHIRPCASFDLTKPEEQAKCFHYSNLQPLWKTTEIARAHGDMVSIGNRNKGAKWTPPRNLRFRLN